MIIESASSVSSDWPSHRPTRASRVSSVPVVTSCHWRLWSLSSLLPSTHSSLHPEPRAGQSQSMSHFSDGNDSRGEKPTVGKVWNCLPSDGPSARVPEGVWGWSPAWMFQQSLLVLAPSDALHYGDRARGFRQRKRIKAAANTRKRGKRNTHKPNGMFEDIFKPKRRK